MPQVDVLLLGGLGGELHNMVVCLLLLYPITITIPSIISQLPQATQRKHTQTNDEHTHSPTADLTPIKRISSATLSQYCMQPSCRILTRSLRTSASLSACMLF